MKKTKLNISMTGTSVCIVLSVLGRGQTVDEGSGMEPVLIQVTCGWLRHNRGGVRPVARQDQDRSRQHTQRVARSITRCSSLSWLASRIALSSDEPIYIIRHLSSFPSHSPYKSI
ncbi:hypothetical protein F3Y22_tig00116974pilonHSYRG00121 [Hibiscus syriacus]|uniref:Uncharacterized protein n=1 Tax=Hibiscus syriacus TaxID=106335 RepID=A0A6A2WH31_HIBSY|nr:hypothetical protein F3Y22_tig00116974pilonHSYRG00121 [Hibiscus syriacus]